MPATLADVARRAGVSLATASRVLNDSAYGVTAELRARVTAAALELQYVPNANAQALARASTSTVGVIVHDVSDPYFSELTRGIQLVGSRAGKLVMICNTYRDRERELAYIRLLHAHRVEALIIAGSGRDEREFSQKLAVQVAAFTAAGGRAVLIGRHNIAGDSVLVDNIGGGRAVAQALLGLGHRRIGVISGPPLLTATRDRFDGFRGALSEAGVELPDTQIANGDFSRDSGAAAAEELLGRSLDLTGIFALNDPMAIGALSVLRARGIAVPDTVSLIGFDDIPIARDITPALTTVRVPMVDMGAHAMELALSPDAAEWRVVQLSTQLVLRGSTAAVAQETQETQGT